MEIYSTDLAKEHRNITYSLPTDDEFRKAETKIKRDCTYRLTDFYDINKDNKELTEAVTKRFEAEFEKMVETKTAFDFIILKTIADLSRCCGFAFITEGNLSASIISYFFGITEYLPFNRNDSSYNPIELLWGTNETPLTPDFSVSVVKEVCDLIPKKLENKLMLINSDSESYKTISVTVNRTCELINILQNKANRQPYLEDFRGEICAEAAQTLLNEYFEDLCVLMRDYGTTGDSFYAVINDGAETVSSFDSSKDENVEFTLNDYKAELLKLSLDLKYSKMDSFEDLLRFYAYLHGSFNGGISIEKLRDGKTLITRDELFSALRKNNVPSDTALEIVKHGVWASDKVKDKYTDILKGYDTEERVIESFKNTRHLWAEDTCISRLIILCAKMWYKIYHREIYEDCIKEFNYQQITQIGSS